MHAALSKVLLRNKPILLVEHVSVFGGIDDDTVKCRISASKLLKPPFTPSKMVLTLQGRPNEPITLTKLYVGHAAGAGDAWDAASFTQVTVNAATSFTIGAGCRLQTDRVAFAWDRVTDIIISMHAGSTPTSDALAADLDGTSLIGTTYLKSGADTAATANDTGFTTFAGYLSLVTAIEVFP